MMGNGQRRICCLLFLFLFSEASSSIQSIPAAAKSNGANENRNEQQFSVDNTIPRPPPPPKEELLGAGNALGSWVSPQNKTIARSNTDNGEPQSSGQLKDSSPSLFSVSRDAERHLPFKGTTDFSSRVVPPPPPRRPIQNERDKHEVDVVGGTAGDHKIKIPPPRPPLPRSNDASNVGEKRSTTWYQVEEVQQRPQPHPKIPAQSGSFDTTYSPFRQRPNPQHPPQTSYIAPQRTLVQPPPKTAPDPPGQTYQQFGRPQFQQPQQLYPSESQYWQQHNQWQHNLPDARENRPKKPSSIFNSLWKKVEQGLDSLADVENSVAEQAQQFVVRRKPTQPRETSPAIHTTPEERFQNRRNNVQSTASRPDPFASQKADWASRRVGRNAIHSRSSGGGPDTAETRTEVSPLRGTQPSTSDAGPTEDSIPQRHASPHKAPFHHVKSQVADQNTMHKEGSGDRRPAAFRALATEANFPIHRQENQERRFPDEDDVDTGSILTKLGRLVPRVPTFRFRRGMSGELAHSALEAWKADEEDSLAQKRHKGWMSIFGKKSSKEVKTDDMVELETPAMESLSTRLGHSATTKETVLKPSEFQECCSIGRQKAYFDILSVGFVILLVQQLRSLEDFTFSTFSTGNTEALFLLWARALESWAPHALACSLLSWQHGRSLARRKEFLVVDEVTESAILDANYGAMLLRLTKGTPIDRKAIQMVLLGARSKIASVIANTRLETFTIFSVAFISIVWGPDFRPAIEHLFALFAAGPRSLSAVVADIKSTLAAMWFAMSTILFDSMTAMLDHPVLFCFKTAVGVALVAVSLLPLLIPKGRQGEVEMQVVDDEEQDDRMFRALTEQLTGFGSSSANRLNLLADSLLESFLDRWILLMSNAKAENNVLSFSWKAVAQRYWFYFLSSVVLLAPFSFFVLGKFDVKSTNTLSKEFGSLFDIACLFTVAQLLSWKAINKTTLSARLNRNTKLFIESIANSIEERKSLKRAPTPSLDLFASISPSAGLSISNVWASFATKRAWALRGTSLSCQNGEVVLVLSCDSSSNSNLFHAIAENLINPASYSRSFISAKGSMSLGGLDVQKWDKKQLRNRIGIVLNDVGSIGDTAKLLSGLALEEILDPRNGSGVQDILNEPGEKERFAMISALKLTGLYSSLLPRLPSKMATVVTSSEEDSRTLSSNPRCELLHPSEWRKLLLARVLARSIYNNENSAASTGSLSNSLVGSTLIIEGISLYFSDVDEATIISELRKTGGAVLLSSDRWSSGRFADTIVIMRDGAVVETGSHEELMGKGIQRSIYAAHLQKAIA